MNEKNESMCINEGRNKNSRNFQNSMNQHVINIFSRTEDLISTVTTEIAKVRSNILRTPLPEMVALVLEQSIHEWTK